MTFKKIGKIIKTYREDAGITQGNLAKKLGYSNAQFVSNWERGLSCVPDKAVTKLCFAVGIPPVYFGRQLLKIRQYEIECAIGEEL